MAVIRYGSYNRPLDFIDKTQFPDNMVISHFPLPIKKGQPFSIIAVTKLLSEDLVYRYELKLMDLENIHAKCTECNESVYKYQQDWKNTPFLVNKIPDGKLVCEYEGELLNSRCWGVKGNMATISEKWVDKYRPKSFKDFVGNRDTLTEIEGFILSGSIPHLFFYGEVGTGKTALAEVVALKLLGEGGSGLIELNASDNREEADIKKKVLKPINYIPFGANKENYRWIVLFDEAEGLKPTAQAILKRPMEKQKKTIFVYTTNEETKIIEAIKSRCSCFEFKRLSDNDIVEGLKRIAVKEGLNMNDNTLMEITKKCKGDMRSAINELQKLASLNNRNVEIDKIVQQYMKQQEQGVKA